MPTPMTPVPDAEAIFQSTGRYLLIPCHGEVPEPQRVELRGLIGSKAAGLISLPVAWTPPFLVISTQLHRDCSTEDQAQQSALVEDAATAIVGHCAAWPGEWDKGLILRSSAVVETLSDRGAYESVELPADFDADVVAAAIQRIYESFRSQGAPGGIAVIVQARVSRPVKGHLSNERRVSKTINQWMWEIETSGNESGRFNSQRAIAPDTHSTLLLQGPDQKQLLALLKRTSRWVTQFYRAPAHLEWGLSKNTLWLFQIDLEDDQVADGVDPNAFLRACDATAPGRPSVGSPFALANFGSPTGWSKVDNVAAFLVDRTAAYPPLFYVTASTFRNAREEHRDLAADVEAIAHGRAICRTDCTSEGIDRLNLQRTTSSSSQQVISFIDGVTRDLEQQGAKAEEICFIVHKFIPAKSAAWALARPDQQIVLVDALWGLPDGLQFLPHDTYEFDIRRGEISAEVIRYKPKFLQETETGDWQLIKVGRQWTRHRSLAIADLREVAIQTHQIAVRLNKAVQVMWFCDVAEEAGVGRNVPWFRMGSDLKVAKGDRPLAPGLEKYVVKNLGDISAARDLDFGRWIIVLDPDALLYRDNEFLKEVAEVARQRNFPVFMTGSILSHAFYALERQGVSVLTDMQRRTRVRQRQRFRKLVRDEIPTKIMLHGERVEIARIPKSESRTALVVKLLEESQELLAAQSPQEVTAELADLLEVVRSLTAATGVDWDEVQQVANEKRINRGSFDQNVVLMETSWPKWEETHASREPRSIKLKDLGEIINKGREHVLTFPAVVAKGAKNIVTLKNGTRVAVAISGEGIELSEIGDRTSVDSQLEFPFEHS